VQERRRHLRRLDAGEGPQVALRGLLPKSNDEVDHVGGQEEPPRLDEAELFPPKRSKPEPMPSFALPTQVNLNDADPVKTEVKYSPQHSNSVSPASVPEENGSPTTNEVVNNSSQKLYCKICHKVFPTKSLLYKHLRGHSSDEKPYKCPECGQGFTLSSNLRQHRIIHRGYKPFQCEFCGKKFMRSNFSISTNTR